MKKKYLFSSLLVGTLFLVACGNDKVTISSDEGNDEKETAVEEEKDTQQEKAGKLEIQQSKAQAWVNSIGTVWVHSAAIYENTGETSVEIGETQMNYKGTDDSILGTSTMIYAVPEVVKPGETAIIMESTILDGLQSPDAFSETTFNFNFTETDQDPNLMEVSGIKGVSGEFGYKVTGLVKNPTEVPQDDVRIAAALFDANGALLGALDGSVDVGIAPGGEAGFELSYPELPEDVASKVATIDVKSYGWTW
ncbi:FxLYD domain-containing protein [Lysinibacillus fusiformis]|nr:FxLYD domain-containing protein [Lysinibacillus fusiformis]